MQSVGIKFEVRAGIRESYCIQTVRRRTAKPQKQPDGVTYGTKTTNIPKCSVQNIYSKNVCV
jgi:hypothetical protein